VTETVDATLTAWQKLPHKDLLPEEILKAIDRQIEGAARNSAEQWH